MNRRQFIRHPSDIPIVIEHEEMARPPDTTRRLKNICTGGLALESDQALSEGQYLKVSIPVVNPAFEFRARVAWCLPLNGHYDIGLEFLEPDKLFKARMVEQICHIEHFRREVREREGRELSGEQAALEWIEKHAQEFPAT